MQRLIRINAAMAYSVWMSQVDEDRLVSGGGGKSQVIDKVFILYITLFYWKINATKQETPFFIQHFHF